VKTFERDDFKMQKNQDDVPAPARLTVGILFNGKKGGPAPTEDAEAEYDNPETVKAIAAALRAGGFETVAMEADASLPDSLAKHPIDIAFNIAEGIRGRGREAEVPALLNMLGIPFTGSDETALAVSLDKAMCKRLLSTYGVATPKSAVVFRMEDLDTLSLRWPVIVKPNAEGSSKGVSEACVVKNAAELRALVEKDLAAYGEPMLCEEYLDGREFTVGILGNGEEARVFPPMEICFKGNTQDDYRVYSFGVKKEFEKYVAYQCPARLTPEQENTMVSAARTAFNALGCCDFTRVDFRMDAAGKPYFIEMNPLPGLAPGYSDFPMLAGYAGVGYNELVLDVLKAALRRTKVEAVK
jgi:D-alanine-D-alanine ligase